MCVKYYTKTVSSSYVFLWTAAVFLNGSKAVYKISFRTEVLSVQLYTKCAVLKMCVQLYRQNFAALNEARVI